MCDNAVLGDFFVVLPKKEKKTRRRRQEGENTQTFVDNPFGVPETRRSGTRGDCAGPARGVRLRGSRGTYRLYLPGCSALKSEKLYVIISFTSRDFGRSAGVRQSRPSSQPGCDWRARPRAARARGLVEVPAVPTSLLLW